MKAAAAAVFALVIAAAFASAPAHATPPAVEPTSHVWPALHTGLSATDVGPLVFGILAEGVHMATFAGCFLALDDNQTCVEIAGKARDDVTQSALTQPQGPQPPPAR